MSLTATYVVAAACIGYVFCLNCYKFRYTLARKSGYYSYLYCTAFGALFLIAGVIANWDFLIVDWLTPLSISEDLLVNPMFLHIARGLIIAGVAIVATNVFFDKTKAIQLAWKDDLSGVLSKAIDLEQPVQITLDTRKVYVGQVFDTIEPDEESSYLSILPLLSGYREEESLELKITHKYDKIVKILRSKKGLDIENYQLVIPKDRIVTCHIFDAEIYQETREKQRYGTKFQPHLTEKGLRL